MMRGWRLGAPIVACRAVAAAVAVAVVVSFAAPASSAPATGSLPVVEPIVRAQRDDETGLVVDLMVSEVENLSSFQAVLLYPGRVLSIPDSTSIAAGGLLTSGGDHFCFEPTIEASALRVSCVSENRGGVSGSGALATVTFSVRMRGGGRISVSRVHLENASGEPIGFQIADARFSVSSAVESSDTDVRPFVILAVAVLLVLGSAAAFTLSRRRGAA